MGSWQQVIGVRVYKLHYLIERAKIRVMYLKGSKVLMYSKVFLCVLRDTMTPWMQGTWMKMAICMYSLEWMM